MIDNIQVLVQRLPHSEGLPLPEYKSEHAAGMDVCAALDGPLEVQPGERALLPTGLKVAIPPGFEIQVRPRSGLALKQGLAVLNSPGTIDADYRGEIKIILANLGQESVTLSRGDRVAQLVMCRAPAIDWREVEALDDTLRAEGGFGHTGVNGQSG
ncbi:dUTP diphosphatase [Candidatus Hydrogenedentota bacterium]